MSKLKSHIIIGLDEGCASVDEDYYLKSEVDKVLAELKDKVLQYKVLDKEHCRDLNTQERFFAKQIAHNKYKRCISLAELCSCMQEQCGFLEIKKWEKREKKWREFAEKFKEAKFLQLIHKEAK